MKKVMIALIPALMLGAVEGFCEKDLKVERRVGKKEVKQKSLGSHINK